MFVYYSNGSSFFFALDFCARKRNDKKESNKYICFYDSLLIGIVCFYNGLCSLSQSLCMRGCMGDCVRACVRACVRVCVS